MAVVTGRVAETWDRSTALIAWSRTLIASSRSLQRPVFRGGTGDGRPAPDSRLGGLTVLVVDDDGDNMDVFATFLRTAGGRVLCAPDALAALAHLDTTASIDVILTDLSMPGVNGIELMTRVRAHPVHAAVPAIAISGFPEKYFATDAALFNTFLLKPIDFERLADIVRQLVATRSA